MRNITLTPNYVSVTENETAVFNCSYSCKASMLNTHTTWWQVGDVRKSRGFSNKKTEKFIHKTGLQVEVKDISNCDSAGNGQIIHQLRINASSAIEWNKTTIQCVAVRLNEVEIDIYSSYGLMFVDPVEGKDLEFRNIYCMQRRKHDTMLCAINPLLYIT